MLIRSLANGDIGLSPPSNQLSLLEILREASRDNYFAIYKLYLNSFCRTTWIVQCILAYQQRLFDLLTLKRGYSENDLTRVFPFYLPLFQLPRTPAPGELISTGVFDSSVSYPIRVCGVRRDPEDPFALQIQLDCGRFANVIIAAFEIRQPAIIQDFFISILMSKRRFADEDIRLLEENLQESFAKNARCFSFVASISNISLYLPGV